MNNSGKRLGRGIFFGLMLIIVGLLWVLHNTGVLVLPIRVWWPLILIFIGLMHLVHHRRIFDFFGWLMMGLGVLFLLITNGFVDKEEAWKYWPVLLVILGLTIIFQRGTGCTPGFRHRIACAKKEDEPLQESSGSEDLIKLNMMFGGLHKKITSTHFKGGSISVIFSGVEIDLRSAELAEEGAVLDISAIFGGVELRLPESWVVETHGSAILGGVNSKYANTEDNQGKRLVIKASAIFGGVEIGN